MDFEKEIAETVAGLPFDPPEDTIGIMEARGLLKGNALIYKAEYYRESDDQPRKKMVEVRCTACGGVLYLQYAPVGGCCRAGVPESFGFFSPLETEVKVSGSECICPRCGEPTKVVHVSRFRNDGYYVINYDYIMTIHNIRGHLCVLSWMIEKLCNKDGNIFYAPYKYEGAVVINDKPVRVVGYHKNIGGFLSWHRNWESRKKFLDLAGQFSKTKIMPFKAETVYDTDAGKSAFERFIEDMPKSVAIRPITYLKLWTRHHNVENLVRNGLSTYVSDVIEKSMNQFGYYYNLRYSIDDKKTKAYIDWKKKKPHEMLQIEKEDVEIARYFDADTVKLFAWCRQRKIRLDRDMLVAAEKIGAEDILEMVQGPIYGYSVPVVHLINYINRQKASGDKNASVRYIKDYWNMLVNVQGSMEPALIWPKSITRAHDEMMMRKKEKEDAALNAKIAETLAARNRLAYSDEATGLMIRPAASHEELIEEGKQLHHCVASYTNEHASGKTTILFIRKINEPDTPFFTLEYKDGRVKQNRGKRNCGKTAEVEEFEAKWLEYIKGVNKNGKRNRTREDEKARAGA